MYVSPLHICFHSNIFWKAAESEFLHNIRSFDAMWKFWESIVRKKRMSFLMVVYLDMVVDHELSLFLLFVSSEGRDLDLSQGRSH